MSDVVIRARDLTKVYRLYSGPGYRFLDMFGLLGNRPDAYTEHAALERVTLEIKSGEKVAFIGRNGAGKSTLLKLITRVIEPTSGTIEVKGKAHALLQIGSGFHPDFTGRENVYAYLAQLGVAGKDADRRCREIVEFAELEEYIDQPVKTYSSGMAVRLMFSTSTAISPDLLVLDEVLGVGDAYFAHKSYNRIRELCDRDGSTLLLVTHDIYSAVSICERVVWIDRGQVLMNGDGPTVVKAYEDSVRQQEESRLRVRNQQRLKDPTSGDRTHRREISQVLVEIYGRENRPQPCPIYFSRIALHWGDTGVASLPLATPLESGADVSHLIRDGANWGEASTWRERPARPLMNFGSPFHKIAGVFAVGLSPSTLLTQSPRLAIDYWSAEPCDVLVRCFVEGKEFHVGPLAPSRGEWASAEMPVSQAAVALPGAITGAVNISGRHGTGAISVVDVSTQTDSGKAVSQFEHAAPFNVLIRYRIQQPTLREYSQVLLAFHRDGIADTTRIITRDLLFDASQGKEGVVRLRLPRLMLANGTYTITVMVAREGYYDRPQTMYFSLNPEVYTCLSRVVEIVVSGAGIVGTGTAIVSEGEWSIGADRLGEAEPSRLV
jgi:ABC-type polysaccharide/polyol phosphate transport system ATPase subunit